MSLSKIDKDSKFLAKFGYKQDLNRSMRGFSSFAISFSLISILTGIFANFHFGYSEVPISVSPSVVDSTRKQTYRRTLRSKIRQVDPSREQTDRQTHVAKQKQTDTRCEANERRTIPLERRSEPHAEIDMLLRSTHSD